MKFLPKLLSIFCLALQVCSLTASVDKSKVYILANSELKESVKLAKKYAQLREIPESNIISLRLPNTLSISRSDFDEKISEPLVKIFFDLGAVKGKIDNYPKAFQKFVLENFDIDFLIICKGVPLKIEKIDPKEAAGNTTEASIDSELTMLFRYPYSLKSSEKNPLYDSRDENLYKKSQILRTARLDAPTYEESANIAANALEVERKGLIGRAYIDIAKKFPQGDNWLESCLKMLDEMGFDTTVEKTQRLLGIYDRLDALAIYFGWYGYFTSLNFLDKSFKFSEGALGFHIYSFSAKNLTADACWTAAFLSRGMSATVGNVNEPFLHLSHRPDKFLEALKDGKNAGFASYYALPSLSWQTVFVGDPLYEPFKYPLKNQLADIDAHEFTEQHAYAVIRQMNLIEKSSGIQAALNFASPYLSDFNGIALTYKIAKTYANMGDNTKALSLLKPFFENPNFKKEELGLILEISDFCASKGEEDLAVKIADYAYNELDKISPKYSALLLDKLIKQTKDYGNTALHAKYSAILAKIKAEEEAKKKPK